MLMIDITRVLEELAGKRKVFHSEADFQHALAWEIHQQWLGCSMRLEFKPPHLDNRIYVDIWAANENATLAVELKYKTRKPHADDVDGETFDLLNQSAQDVGRYDFLKDIQRLEQIVSGQNDIVGYAILLTNDRTYWNPPRNNQTVDASFRIHEGRSITGELSWRAGTSKGTMRDREEPIVIRGTYKLLWQDYSELRRAKYGNFRYLLVKVDGGHGA